MRFLGGWKAALGKLLLLAVSLSAAVAMVELLVLPRLMQNPPLKMQRGFTHSMQILTQSSKREMLPRDYILLLGDSFARGYGDWLDNADKNLNPPYHSAHVLHELTGRDVLSFGKGGAGSIMGLVITPGKQLNVLTRRGLEPPRTVLIYFYEGNDIWNNIRYLRRHYNDDYDMSRVLDSDYFDAFLEDEYRRRAGLDLSDRIWAIGYLQGLWTSLWRDGKEAMEPGEINKVLVNGEPLPIPDEIQSPGLEFTEEELQIGFHIADRSMNRMQSLFPDSDIHLVYIAAPLSICQLASEQVSIQTYLKRGALHPAARVQELSLRTRREMQQLSAKYNVGFLDPTPDLQAAARTAILHGPGDWKHFNESGYRLLATLIADYLGSDPRN